MLDFAGLLDMVRKPNLRTTSHANAFHDADDMGDEREGGGESGWRGAAKKRKRAGEGERVGSKPASMVLALLLPQIAAQLAGSGIRAGSGMIHQGVSGARQLAGGTGGVAGRGAIAGLRWGYGKATGRGSGGSIKQR